MYRYHDPKTVISPQDCIQSVKVIYDGSDDPGYSIAIVRWQGVDKVALRWNISQREWGNPDKQSGKVICLGEPNSRGYATWFIVPVEFIISLISNDNIAKNVKEALQELNIL